MTDLPPILCLDCGHDIDYHVTRYADDKVALHHDERFPA